MIEHVFVYGTLKHGGSNRRLVAPYVREESEGSVPGSLVDLGAYPGWVEGEGEVRGELLRVDPVEETLAVLDELEGYHGPGDPRNLYERVLVDVWTAGGAVGAWAYRYLGPTRGRPLVAGGRWETGRKERERGERP